MRMGGAPRGVRRTWQAILRILGSVVALAAVPILGATQTTPSAGIRLDRGRFTVVADARDARLAETLLAAAQRQDTFPGLPRPRAKVLIAIAKDPATFRAWIGPGAPEWGAAIAIPDEQRLILQGRFAGSAAGDPRVALRHELAHLALHEQLGRLPPRWFDEGYASVAAGEWSREQAFETSVGMVWRTLPTLTQLEDGFLHGGTEATWSYAMAHRAVSELSHLGGPAGLTHFLAYWQASGSFERAVRSAFGMTGEGFDRHWRQQTRRRYGALSLVTDLSLAVGLCSLFAVPVYISKRRRDRAKLEAMRAVDAAQEREAAASALQAMLEASTSPVPTEAPLPTLPAPQYPAG